MYIVATTLALRFQGETHVLPLRSFESFITIHIKPHIPTRLDRTSSTSFRANVSSPLVSTRPGLSFRRKLQCNRRTLERTRCFGQHARRILNRGRVIDWSVSRTKINHRYFHSACLQDAESGWRMRRIRDEGSITAVC